MVKTHTLDIGEVARRSRLPASTLRYYEEKGLIRSEGRRGLRRLFDPGVLDQLAFITLGRIAGFTLDDLAAMATADRSFAVDREKVRNKAAELDRKIEEMTALVACLRHVVECSAESHFSCPTFKRLLGTAGRHRSRAGR
jgi:DNA-binding transcriptional MerR regulator